MCYLTVLSTTSGIDLSLYNNDLVRFARELPGVSEERFLRYKFKWFIGSKSGCSCDFRHLCEGSTELGFSPPEDWYPEKSEHLVATRRVCATFRKLVALGEQVDCVDAWASDSEDMLPLAGDTEVELAAVADDQFRFFERHRFNFV